MKNRYDVTNQIIREIRKKDAPLALEIYSCWLADEIRVVAVQMTVDSFEMENLKGSTFNPSLHPEIPREKIEEEEREFEDRVERMGVFGLVGEFKNEAGDWVHADSCWGFVGEDYLGSGYDEDIIRATLTDSPSFKGRYA